MFNEVVVGYYYYFSYNILLDFCSIFSLWFLCKFYLGRGEIRQLMIDWLVKVEVGVVERVGFVVYFVVYCLGDIVDNCQVEVVVFCCLVLVGVKVDKRFKYLFVFFGGDFWVVIFNQ